MFWSVQAGPFNVRPGAQPLLYPSDCTVDVDDITADNEAATIKS